MAESTCVFCDAPLEKSYIGPIVVVAEHRIPDLKPITCPFSNTPLLEVGELKDRMTRTRKLNGEPENGKRE